MGSPRAGARAGGALSFAGTCPTRRLGSTCRHYRVPHGILPYGSAEQYARDKSRLKPAGSSNALTATTGAHTPPREILRVVSESALIARIVLEEFNRYAARASPTVPRGPTDPPRIPIAPHERRHAACARPCAALVISTTFPDRYPRQSTTLTLPLTDQAPTPQVQALAGDLVRLVH